MIEISRAFEIPIGVKKPKSNMVIPKIINPKAIQIPPPHLYHKNPVTLLLNYFLVKKDRLINNLHCFANAPVS
jgi:hypothetical protein